MAGFVPAMYGFAPLPKPNDALPQWGLAALERNKNITSPNRQAAVCKFIVGHSRAPSRMPLKKLARLCGAWSPRQISRIWCAPMAAFSLRGNMAAS